MEDLTRAWSKCKKKKGVVSVVIDLMPYFHWPCTYYWPSNAHMLPSLLLTPLAVWHFAVIQYKINLCSAPVWQRILILDITFIILYNPLWKMESTQSADRSRTDWDNKANKDSAELLVRKRKWGTRDRLSKCLFSLSCNFPNITRHFTSSTLVIISSCA